MTKGIHEEYHHQPPLDEDTTHVTFNSDGSLESSCDLDGDAASPCSTNVDDLCVEHDDNGCSRSRSDNKERKHIHWESVQIHTHTMRLGDNPSVSAGVPVTIGWKRVSIETMSIDDFEHAKLTMPFRNTNDLLLPKTRREAIVRAAGSSRSEMIRESFLAKQIQEDRCKSAKDGAWRRRLLRPFARRGHHSMPSTMNGATVAAA